ncbi:MAG TPA: L-aspartate oxidase [Syntrophorhabdaceae bacterium]|nr:L-aspartate oxidase [Syntrophorhabdaceae bacterium]HQM82115.1 L-aspartate oxidase [Syntrophorhabdaceae bacterium]
MNRENRHYCDVLVIGSGIAGLSAAITAAESGLDVIVITKETALEESNTYYAQGGIVSRGEDDSPEFLIDDIMEAGDGISNRKAVDILAYEGPALVEEFLIKKVGVPFSRTENTEYEYAREASHSKRRILHCMDTTGRAIEESLARKAGETKNVRLFMGHTAIDLLTIPHHSTNPLSLYMEPQCIGAYVLNNGSELVERIFSSYVILATGGLGRIYLHTTNPAVATGEGFAMAHRAGARLINMEYIQFHPTTLFHKDVDGFLISEALRGEGARLKTRDNMPFMDRYSPLGELAPRDEVSRAIYEEMIKRGDPYVYLDIASYASIDIKRRFPNIYERCKSLDIDISKSPIPVVPAAHYSCGGVQVDLDGRTSLKNLYAAGEVTATGIHGANRLASTSLLEGLVWGIRAARHIAGSFDNTKPYKESEIPPWRFPEREEEVDPALIRQDWVSIKSTMWNYVGIIRTIKRLERAREDLGYLKNRIDNFYRRTHLVPMVISLRNGIRTALIVAEAAFTNRESRGAHYIK